jgi:hypothetical protein
MFVLIRVIGATMYLLSNAVSNSLEWRGAGEHRWEQVRKRTEVPDLKNGATKASKRTEKQFVVFGSSVSSGAPILRSGSFVFSGPWLPGE